NLPWCRSCAGSFPLVENGKALSMRPSMELESSLDRGRQMILTDDVSTPQAQAETFVLSSETVIDRYRCPQDFIDIVASEPLPSNSGFFRFGQNGICYGRSGSDLSSRPESSLHDAAGDAAVENGKLRLPFDLKEVIDNLRLERYRNGEATESSLFRFCKK